VSHLRRSWNFEPVSPALTGWANLWRAYGAQDGGGAEDKRRKEFGLAVGLRP